MAATRGAARRRATKAPRRLTGDTEQRQERVAPEAAKRADDHAESGGRAAAGNVRAQGKRTPMQCPARTERAATARGPRPAELPETAPKPSPARCTNTATKISRTGASIT